MKGQPMASDETNGVMSHDYLVERAARWLTSRHRCSPVFAEHKCWATPESPDAFGVNAAGTVVVECKRSVSDFYADRRKPFRINPEQGMGRLRYYLTPKGLIDPNRLSLLPGWGLAEVCGSKIRIVKESEVFVVQGNQEALLMRSAWLMRKDF